MDAKFLSAAYRIPPVVLGRQLKPFCCGHAQSLYALQSPYMLGGDIQREDLIVAIWLCSMDSQTGRQKLLSESNNIIEEGLEWGKEIITWDFHNHAQKFDDYLKEYIKSPPMWKKSEHKEAKSPWPLRIVVILMREFSMSKDEAENMPLPMALWWIATINDLNGDGSLISEKEQERIRIAKEMAAKNG